MGRIYFLDVERSRRSRTPVAGPTKKPHNIREALDRVYRAPKTPKYAYDLKAGIEPKKIMRLRHQRVNTLNWRLYVAVEIFLVKYHANV